MSSSGSKTSTKPISRLGRAHIKDIIGAKASTPEAANNLLKVLRVLLSHAVEIGMIASNPAIGVKRYRRHGDGIHTWTEAEVAQFETSHPIGAKARLALELLLGTGQRRSDVVGGTWSYAPGRTMISMKARPTRNRLQRKLGFDTIMQLNQKLDIPNEPSE